MMREILFRGKRIDNDECAEGFMVICDDRYFILSKTKINCLNPEWLKKGEYAFCCFIEVDPKTVGQFTGLTDKNGKKIFEGDVVTFETTAYSFKPHVVAWSFTKMRFIVHGREANYPMDIDFKYEVIGNIHDNPDDGGSDNG